MTSGTLVLTDAIDKAFKNIFTEQYQGTDAVISGKQAIRFEGEGSERPSIQASLLPEVRQQPSVAAATGLVVDATAAKILDKEDKVVDTGGAPAFGFGVDFSQARFNPLKLKSGRWPSSENEVAIDAGTADEVGYKVGDMVKVASLGPVRSFRLTGIASLRRPGVAWGRHVRRLHDPDRPEALRPQEPVRCDLDRSGPGGRSRKARQRPRAAAAGERRGAHCNRTDSRGPEAGRVHEVHPLLPALVRGDRPLRRRVRHLQHAVDHRRATRARVRDAADDRSVAASGADRRHARGAHHRLPRLGRRADRRTAPGARRQRALQGRERRSADDRPEPDDVDRRLLAPPRHARHARRRDLPRRARDEGAADRRGQRGRDAACVTHLEVHAVHRARRGRDRRRAACLRHVRRGNEHSRQARFARDRLPLTLRGRRADLAPARAVDRGRRSSDREVDHARGRLPRLPDEVRCLARRPRALASRSLVPGAAGARPRRARARPRDRPGNSRSGLVPPRVPQPGPEVHGLRRDRRHGACARDLGHRGSRSAAQLAQASRATNPTSRSTRLRTSWPARTPVGPRAGPPRRLQR